MSDFISLLDFVPAITPRFATPRHLTPLAKLIERIARGESVRAVVSIPPRRGKTELLKHAQVWLLLQNPALQLCYASYAQRIAEKKSRGARELARRAGVPLSLDSKSRSDWRTTVDDGGVWTSSTQGALTGEGFDVIILDDLIKGRAEAESGTHREHLRDWLLTDVLTRLEPGGSIVLSMARWHPEDPAGFALELGWELVNLTAITADGESLWPERWPLDEVLRLRDDLGGEDGYEWQSLYCGNPRGRGARVFGDVVFYDELPERLQISIGLDFAYSSSKTADASAAVVLGRDPKDEHFYVLDVQHMRAEPPVFRARVQGLLERYRQARVTAYVSGTEAGTIAFFRDGGVHVHTLPASADKFTRAIGAAAAWNTGRLLLPRSAHWLDAFVSELCSFTGVKDRHDDQVDAIAAAFDAVASAWIGDAPGVSGPRASANLGAFGGGIEQTTTSYLHHPELRGAPPGRRRGMGGF